MNSINYALPIQKSINHDFNERNLGGNPIMPKLPNIPKGLKKSKVFKETFKTHHYHSHPPEVIIHNESHTGRDLKFPSKISDEYNRDVQYGRPLHPSSEHMTEFISRSKLSGTNADDDMSIDHLRKTTHDAFMDAEIDRRNMYISDHTKFLTERRGGAFGPGYV